MIKLFRPYAHTSIDKPLLQTLHSGYITQGPKVEEFEQRLMDFLGTKNLATVNSGTSALVLALRLAGVGPGDEVVTTPMTCSATNLPILQAGAIPVFADVHPETGMIDPDSVAKKITKKTKAIICVDWGGCQPDLDLLVKIARAHKVKLIEDAAHAFGARYKDQMVGTIADYTCFSLQAIKHITTGDGGIITTKTAKDTERAKRLRWFGIKRDSKNLDSRIAEDITEWGYKFHMNDLTATIGIVQMDYIRGVLMQHQAIANIYDKEICSCIVKPKFSTDSVYWFYNLVFPNSKVRDKFKRFMADRDIQVSEVHRRNDEYSVFRPYAKEALPGLNKFAARQIAIPVQGLFTYEALEVASAVNYFAEQERL